MYGNTGPVLIWLNFASREEVNELHEVWHRRYLSEPLRKTTARTKSRDYICSTFTSGSDT
jgi:hypothetical protein